jgi:hypothetical protein
MTCQMTVSGDYVAPELAGHQTIDNLARFSQRLEAAYPAARKMARYRKGTDAARPE